MYFPSSSHPHSGQPWLRTSLFIFTVTRRRNQFLPLALPVMCQGLWSQSHHLLVVCFSFLGVLTGFQKWNQARLSLVPSALDSLQSYGSQSGWLCPRDAEPCLKASLCVTTGERAQLATGWGGRSAAFTLCTALGKRLTPRAEVEKPDPEGKECWLSLLYTLSKWRCDRWL